MNFTVKMPPNHQFMLNTLPMEPMSRTYQYRKIMKPMLERKRRARINKCLDELKDLMTGTLQADGENVSKLEKADILELTVRHLQRLREKNALFLRHNENVNMEKFWAGFQHCATEVAQFLTKYDQQIGGDLIQHISSYVPNIRAASTPPTPPASITSRLMAANFSAPRALLRRELTAYNQRIFNKIPAIGMASLNTQNIIANKCEENLERYHGAVGREFKKELMEEGNSVWRPW